MVPSWRPYVAQSPHLRPAASVARTDSHMGEPRVLAAVRLTGIPRGASVPCLLSEHWAEVTRRPRRGRKSPLFHIRNMNDTNSGTQSFRGNFLRFIMVWPETQAATGHWRRQQTGSTRTLPLVRHQRPAAHQACLFEPVPFYLGDCREESQQNPNFP